MRKILLNKAAFIAAASLLLILAMYFGWQELLSAPAASPSSGAISAIFAVPGDYMEVKADRELLTPGSTVRVEYKVTNPDPQYRLNLIVYTLNPPGFVYQGTSSGWAIDKIVDARNLAVPALPGPAQEGAVIQGVAWNEELGPAETSIFWVDYITYSLPGQAATLKAIAYDGLSGLPVDEQVLVFKENSQAQAPFVPTPTPRFRVEPAEAPAAPAGRAFTPTLAASLQSQSFEGHGQAVQGLGEVGGSDIISVPEEVYPYQIRSLSMTQCYYLGVYTVNRALAEFDTRQVKPDFKAAYLRVRTFIPNPPGHSISVYRGHWEWLFKKEKTRSPLLGSDNIMRDVEAEIDVTNQAAWGQHDPQPLTTWPATQEYTEIKNIPLPHEAIVPGGITKLMFKSSAEALLPPDGSCYSGLPGHGGAMALPELYIE